MTQKRTENKIRSKQEGVILVIALLVISITISVSLSIVTITIKEIKLTGYVRESERAFIAVPLESAANGLQYTPFATSTAWTAASINMANVTCNNGAAYVRLDSLPGWGYSVGNATSRTTGPYVITYTDGTSADVTVFKNGINTTITSNGYNTSVVANPRRTQRTIVANYNL